jgi:hypothetical protein
MHIRRLIDMNVAADNLANHQVMIARDGVADHSAFQEGEAHFEDSWARRSDDSADALECRLAGPEALAKVAQQPRLLLRELIEDERCVEPLQLGRES